jgi:glutathione reductase (NADPH)
MSAVGFDCDLFVIGAGSGGVRAARIAARHGAKVVIAEEYRVGGTCVIRGCVPKKLLVYASQYAEAFEDAVGFGWTTQEVAFDWPTLIAAKDREIARLEAAYVKNLEAAGCEIIRERASLKDRHTVQLAGGRTIRARIILVATGAAPNLDPALPGVEHAITSNEAFHLPQLPERVVVAGGGYIAVEFAGIFNGLGVDTTLVYRGDQILRGFDDDVRAGLAAEMKKKGITLVLGQVFTRIERAADGTLRAGLTGGDTLETDAVMFAIGRKPNTAHLGLEHAGVDFTAEGAIKVDAYSRTSVENIYAVGDVTNRVNLTPVAIREGHAFADTLFGGKPTAVDHATIPSAVFSQPEIGTVGLTEAQARARFPEIDIYRTNFRPMRHTLSGRDERMLMKLVVDAASDRVLGCHIMGPDAAEMVQLLAIAVKMGARKADFDATMALHPSAAEELVTMREKWQPR